MHVRHLSLKDFRNYQTAELSLVTGPNVLAGSNGQGKTNLVEALGYFSTLGSHRVSTDHALIRFGENSAIVRAMVENDDREVLVELQINRSGANRAQINRGAIRPRELPRHFSSVLFAPEDLALVRGEPSARRRFFDELLVLRNPRYAGVIGDYERALRQRNSLLKTARVSGLRGNQLSTLDVWDERLIALGSEIIAARIRLVNELRPHVIEAYAQVAGADHRPRLTASLSIESADPDSDDSVVSAAADDLTDDDIAGLFTQALANVRRRELERGITLIGPHRDDVVFELNGLPAKGYASHGESWSFALALKLASAQLLRIDSPLGDPVLVLDDVFAELDEARRERLGLAVGSYEQVIITAAVENDIPSSLLGHVVRIKAGTIVDPNEGSLASLQSNTTEGEVE